MTTPDILVPLDGTPAALAALPVARGLASVLRAAVRELQVGTAQEPRAEPLVRAARERSDALITMTTRSGELPPAQTLGPIAQQILMEGTTPIVFVNPARNAAGWQLRHLLLPHDGTPATSAADRPAAQLANAARARLSVLHVAVAGAQTPAEPGSFPVGQYADQPQHEWPEWAGEFLDRLTCFCPIDRGLLRIHLARGEPAAEILHFAEAHGVDLIVLAWHGALEAEHATVIKRVLPRAACPVMVVRATGR